MNYALHYNKLIQRARDRVTNYYTEKHHVYPKCMGGDNDLSNIVNLTPEEHFIAHLLLAKIYVNQPKLWFAANMMCTGRSNKAYGWIRRRLSQVMANDNPNKGGLARRKYNALHGSPNKGHRHTTETKKLISTRMTGEKNPNKSGLARKTKTTLVCVNTGEKLHYDSLKEAERAHAANHASVYNNRKTNTPYRGYYWYVGEEFS